MADNTPSSTSEEAAPAGAVAPAESAPTSEAAPQEAAPAGTPTEWSPETLPETDRARAKAWADREAEKFHLRKMGERGADLRPLAPETREKLKRDPAYVERLEAQLEESRRMTGGVNVPKQETQGPDEFDAVTKELQDEFNLDDANTKLSRRIVEKAVRLAEKKLAEPLGKQATEAVSAASLKRQFDAVASSPEWQDETEKGQEFRERFLGKMQMNRQTGQVQDPETVHRELKAKLYPTQTAAPTPARAKPSMGDSPSGGLKPPAPVAADSVEAWDNKLRQKGVDPRFW